MDRQLHLLFMDDEQLLHDLFTRLFSRLGIRVPSCSNAASAIETLKLQTTEDLERYVILQTLKETSGNQQRAAEMPGISARTLRNRLRKERRGGNRGLE
jgi:DNA-binding NtrC family response regulator